MLWINFFFFSSRRRHTRSTRDWSSDVCSSDLAVQAGAELHAVRLLDRELHLGRVLDLVEGGGRRGELLVDLLALDAAGEVEGVGARRGRDEPRAVVARRAELADLEVGFEAYAQLLDVVGALGDVDPEGVPEVGDGLVGLVVQPELHAVLHARVRGLVAEADREHVLADVPLFVRGRGAGADREQQTGQADREGERRNLLHRNGILSASSAVRGRTSPPLAAGSAPATSGSTARAQASEPCGGARIPWTP